MGRDYSVGVKRLAATALCSALICICALITVPLPLPISFTLQTFGVYFALFFLGGKYGSLSVLIYVMLGAVGLPVFSGFSGGLSRLFDTGGGFILGFLLGALTFWLISSFPIPAARAAAAVGSLLIIYLSGALWYALVYLGGVSALPQAVLLTVLPYVLPDAVKISLAYPLASRTAKIIRGRY